ncbi:MAG: NAD(P)H-binding protein, partial [Flavobacteriaceae bacterium]|nr:NAD(P)H-binding protein [Flavobacteriaceae bacterium]
GTIGRTLVSLLHDHDVHFKVLVRNEEKAKPLNDIGIETCIGELGDWSSIASALSNIDSVFLLTGPSMNKVDEQNGFIDLAKKEGIRKIVKIPAVGAQTGSKVHLADWHGQIEDHLKNSGLEYIILRPHSFMQNMLMHLDTIKNQNCFYESLGDSKIPMIDTRDIAQAAYDCLMRDDLNNQTYVLTGPSSISFEEMTKALSNATDRTINCIHVSAEAHNQGMKAAGVPDWLADDLTAMRSDWNQIPVNEPTSDFNKISKTKQYDVSQFAKDHATYFT